MIKDGDDAAVVVSVSLLKLMFRSRRWEDRLGAVQGSVALLECPNTSEAFIQELSEYSANCLVPVLETLIVDDEPRVRDATSMLLARVWKHTGDSKDP
jgi:hypothetical protein